MIKDCPCCKRQVELWEEEDPYYPGGPVVIGYYIECFDCQLRMSGDNKGNLIERWNEMPRN